MQSIRTILIFIFAGILEVAGDALIRKGLRGSGFGFIAGGFIVLGAYGIMVNMVKWDFSRLLGVYVAVFVVISVLFGRYFFDEKISGATLLGTVIIVLGGLIIQFGQGFTFK
ncbi:MAG: hypothetical protein HY965_02050 [Ignavibacteriales bacterium]|nr:hypothetical protein [Ignavibacteriales bacterium]